MTDDDFYREVGILLGTPHQGEAFPWHARTRWNNRKAGRGRYPGAGTVRVFGDIVHVSLHSPIDLRAVVEGRTEAMELIKKRIGDARAPRSNEDT